MLQCICSHTPPTLSTSTSKFTSDQQHYLSMLETNCSTMKDLHKVHAHLLKTGRASHNSTASRLLAFTSTSPAGDINYAFLIFNQIQNPNLFIWNTIIRGFSQSTNPQMAISLFIDMLINSCVEPNRLTYPSVFKAYAELGLAENGAQLHGRIVKLGLLFDPFIRNTIINMYANCGFFCEANKCFEDGKNMDVVAWNSMLTSLAKFEKLNEARLLFDKMPHRNTVSWSSMISGYVRCGKWLEALDLFRQMQEENMKPNEFTLVSLLNASSCLGALKQGEWIHDYIRKNNIKMNSIVITAIIDMYCKCGSIEMARQVFHKTPIRGLSCWNSMILGLAMNGCQDEAIQLFSNLEESSLKPDNVSFIGVLMACNHSGLVNKAKYYFSLMTKKYNITPSIKHYGLMVDVLGRAGFLREADVLIRSMPMNPDVIIWGSLLSSCRSYSNIEMGKWALKNLLQLDSNESSGHVLLSNVYADSGYYEKAIEERVSMKQKKIKKQPGCSLIEVHGEVHEFVAGGRLHPQSLEIYRMLKDLNDTLQKIDHENGRQIVKEEFM